jgi:glyoxylase I family protein
MHLIQTFDAGVLELRLNRPERLNALTCALAQDLLQAVRGGVADPAVCAILLTGEGRAFCAGKDRDDPATDRFVDTLQALAAALVQSPKPVVTAVQGWVVGAGFELMLNGDLTVAARSARFVLPEVHVGLFGTGGVAALLPRLVGLQKAKGLLMLGQEVNAEAAEGWGLVWQVVDDDALTTHARQLAQQLARPDPALLAEVKQLVHREQLGDFGAALAREAAVHQRLPGANAAPAIRPREIDHLVLRVLDLDRMLGFYCGALGCTVERRQDNIGLVQLRAGRSLIDLVPVDGELGRAGGAAPAKEGGRNLDHFCLRVEPFDEAAIRQALQAHGAEAGPLEQRNGAEGEGPSIYLTDPEGNVVELKGPPQA